MAENTCSFNNPFDPDHAIVMAKAGSFGEALKTLAESVGSAEAFYQSVQFR